MGGDGRGTVDLGIEGSATAAIAARAVLGLGDAFTFVSVLRLVPYWFPPQQVPLVTQLTGICGQLGQVLSALPFLAMLAGKVGDGVSVGAGSARWR